MRVTGLVPDLRVPDTEAARRFWCDLLGLEHQDLGLDWVTRFVAPGGQAVQVLTRDATAPEDPAVTVMVDDVRAAYDAVRAAGHEVVHPLTREEWGVRRFLVRAPGGAVLNLVEHAPLAD